MNPRDFFCPAQALEHELNIIEMTTDTFASPHEALLTLIAWHAAAATDPAVNGGFSLQPVNQGDGE